MQFLRPCVIHNPMGGSASPELLAAILNELQARGKDVQTLATGPEPHSARTLTQTAIAGGADLLIALGGDGTVLEVAEAAMQANLPIAAYQDGTSNVFASSFYSRLAPPDFCQMLIDGEPQAIDVLELELDKQGKKENRLALVGLCTGAIAQAVTGAPRAWKRIFGSLVYIVRVAARCLDPELQQLKFTTGKKEWSAKLATAVVLNVDHSQRMPLSLSCNASDGLMDLVLLQPRNLVEILTTGFWLALNRPQRSRHYKRYRLSELAIEAKDTVHLNIDGEEAQAQKLNLRVSKGALRMIVAP